MQGVKEPFGWESQASPDATNTVRK